MVFLAQDPHEIRGGFRGAISWKNFTLMYAILEKSEIYFAQFWFHLLFRQTFYPPLDVICFVNCLRKQA